MIEYQQPYERFSNWIPVLEVAIKNTDPRDKATISICDRCIACIKEMDKPFDSKDYYAGLAGEFRGLMYALKKLEEVGL